MHIIDQQKEMIAKLTGTSEIEPGVILEDRFLERNRIVVQTYLFNNLRELKLDAKRHAYGRASENIYGTLKATVDTDEYIVLGAHFDTVKNSPGANDNASGVVLVYFVALQLVAQKKRTKNFVFVFFDEEENNLIGSSHFAKKLVDERWNIHSVHTVDQVAWDRDGDRAIELELPPDYLRDFYRNVKVADDFEMPIHVTRTSSSDHSSFRSHGFDAVGITEEYVHHDTTPHWHKPTDTFDTVDFRYLEHTTHFVLHVMTNLAS